MVAVNGEIPRGVPDVVVPAEAAARVGLVRGVGEVEGPRPAGDGGGRVGFAGVAALLAARQGSIFFRTPLIGLVRSAHFTPPPPPHGEGRKTFYS